MPCSCRHRLGLVNQVPIGVILGLCRGLYWDTGKYNGSYYLEFRGLGFRESAKEGLV